MQTIQVKYKHSPGITRVTVQGTNQILDWLFHILAWCDSRGLHFGWMLQWRRECTRIKNDFLHAYRPGDQVIIVAHSAGGPAACELARWIDRSPYHIVIKAVELNGTVRWCRERAIKLYNDLPVTIRRYGRDPVPFVWPWYTHIAPVQQIGEKHPAWMIWEPFIDHVKRYWA